MFLSHHALELMTALGTWLAPLIAASVAAVFVLYEIGHNSIRERNRERFRELLRSAEDFTSAGMRFELATKAFISEFGASHDREQFRRSFTRQSDLLAIAAIQVQAVRLSIAGFDYFAELVTEYFKRAFAFRKRMLGLAQQRWLAGGLEELRPEIDQLFDHRADVLSKIEQEGKLLAADEEQMIGERLARFLKSVK